MIGGPKETMQIVIPNKHPKENIQASCSSTSPGMLCSAGSTAKKIKNISQYKSKTKSSSFKILIKGSSTKQKIRSMCGVP